ncbi:hypothetical protein ES703_14028 [subsurface metagenome]
MREEFKRDDDMPSAAEIKRRQKENEQKAREREAKKERDYQGEVKDLLKPFFDNPIDFINRFYLNDRGREQERWYLLLISLTQIKQALNDVVEQLARIKGK